MDYGERELTLVLIKPDALKNSLTGYLLSQLSEFHTGLHFAGTKILHVSEMLAGEHYAEHRGKVFFPSLIDYIIGRIHYAGQPSKQRVIAIAYQGKDSIRKVRDIVGPTNPHVARDTRPGSLRSLGSVVPIKDAEGKVIGERMDNLIHASANPDDAEREIKLWFKPDEIPPLMHAYPTVRNDTFYYYREKKLFTNPEPDSLCFLVPGEIAWKSDLESLKQIHQGMQASSSLETVVSKYIVNR
jgi:nucleoside-diphosphate kinase